MANIKHYNGTTELTGVHYEGKQLVGQPIDFTPTYDHMNMKWNRHYVPVQRSVNYKKNPSKHECDARCMNASGRTMNCECSCGGKNHGLRSFICDAA
jgi:hypothetical protein